jgi:hypothetical protein
MTLNIPSYIEQPSTDTQQELSQLKDSIQLQNTIDKPTQQAIQSVLKYLYTNQDVDLSFDVADLHHNLKISHLIQNPGKSNQQITHIIHLSQRLNGKVIENQSRKITHDGRTD